MRLHSVEAIAIDIPLTRNFGGSTYAVLKRSTVVTRLRTDEGLVSEVYNGDNREHGAEIVRLIHDDLAPLLRGRELLTASASGIAASSSSQLIIIIICSTYSTTEAIAATSCSPLGHWLQGCGC